MKLNYGSLRSESGRLDTVRTAGIAAYGSNLFVVIGGNGVGSGVIGEYHAATRASVKAALVTGLNGPVGIAVLPEPSSLILAGLAAWGLRRRKR